MGTFSIYLEESNKAPGALYQIEGSQRDGWEQFQVNFVISNNARIVLEHKTVFSLTNLGDLAVDDIKITPLGTIAQTTTPANPDVSTTQSSSSVPTSTDISITTPMKTSTSVKETTPSTSTPSVIHTSSEASEQIVNAEDDVEDTPGLNEGGIAGIVFGAAFAVLLSVAVLFLVIRSKHS